MWSLPTGGGGGGGLGAELGWLAAVPCCVEFWSFDVPHAAIENAVTPASSGINNRVREGPDKVTVIDASPIASISQGRDTRCSGRLTLAVDTPSARRAVRSAAPAN